MRTTMLAALAMLPVCSVALAAQERDSTLDRRGLPRDIAREAAALYNAPATLRTTGPLEISAGREVQGDIAVLNGPLTIAGHVLGRVLALNSQVILRRTAKIDGDLLIVGGDVQGRDSAEVGGEIRVYRETFRFDREGDRVIAERDTEPDEGERWWRRFERHRSVENRRDFQIASAGAYNRVEGLPIKIGPKINQRFDWGSARLDAYGIVRTGSSFAANDNDVGHNVEGELRLGRLHGFAFGGRIFNDVEPVEGWQLSELEVALASFLAHRDYRDYYQRHGASGLVSLFAFRNVSLTGEFSDERWSSREEHDPFTLLRNEEEWRPNPLVDIGRMHVANGTLKIDTRNDEQNPWTGWYVTADWERGVGSLQQPAAALLPPPSGTTTGVYAEARRVDYTRGVLDIRRYNRLSPDAQLNARVVVGGWLNGDPLPIERRLSIDGPGVMPGFGFRTLRSGADVGTCTVNVVLPGQPAMCDRIALAQVEYRSDLRFDIGRLFNWGYENDVDELEAPRASSHRLHREGDWVLFADAGRGWLVSSAGNALNYDRNELPPLSSFRTDLGGGFDYGGLGVYVAKAISSAGEPMRFFVRLRHRF